ncbi:MAG TPA: hypothetical protein PLE22_01460 [Acidovorax sp.]|nr:hypothetical protein [Acidovorax sp.]
MIKMAADYIETEKHCRKCGKDWPAELEFFHADPRSRDGLCHCCKACYRESVKDHRRLTVASLGPHASDAIAPLLSSPLFAGGAAA